MNATRSGTVISVIQERGFGFIKPDDGTPNIFFHTRNLARGVLFDVALKGQVVDFEDGADHQGRGVAVNVRPR